MPINPIREANSPVYPDRRRIEERVAWNGCFCLLLNGKNDAAANLGIIFGTICTTFALRN